MCVCVCVGGGLWYNVFDNFTHEIYAVDIIIIITTTTIIIIIIIIIIISVWLEYAMLSDTWPALY